MRAVITVIGKDMVGILAKVATECAKNNANIVDVTQSVLSGTFAMVMVVDIEKLNCSLPELAKRLEEIAAEMGLVCHVVHEDLFNSMHRI